MKRIIFPALIAVLAIGGAFASNAKSQTFNAKVSGTTGGCKTNVACHPDPTATCIISGVQYTGTNTAGTCAASLALN